MTSLRAHRSVPKRPTDPPLLILTSLANDPKHGSAPTEDIAEFAGVRLGPGTLYGAIARLGERGLIEALPADGRARPYRIATAVRQQLADALTDLQRIVAAGTARMAAGPWRPAGTEA